MLSLKWAYILGPAAERKKMVNELIDCGKNCSASCAMFSLDVAYSREKEKLKQIILTDNDIHLLYLRPFHTQVTDLHTSIYDY